MTADLIRILSLPLGFTLTSVAVLRERRSVGLQIEEQARRGWIKMLHGMNPGKQWAVASKRKNIFV